MKKKVIGTSILLLILLLGYCGISYAQSFSPTELKNIMYNSLTNFGEHDTQIVKDAIDNYSGWETLSGYTEDYTYVSIARNIETNSLNTGNYDLTIVLNNNESKKSTVTYYYVNAYYTIRYKNGVITDSLGGGNLNTYIQQNGYSVNAWRYNDLPFYNSTSSTATTITLQSGWHPSNIDEGIYVDIPPFAFIEEPTTEHGNVYEFENVPVYEKPQQSDLLLGFLMIPDNITITDFRIDRYYYQGGDWQQKVITYDQNNPYLLRRYYTRVDNITSYNYWYKQENIYKDNIYYIRWGDTTSEPYQWAYCIFYVKSDGTTISGGMIHNPSGDPIQDIINNGNENDDFWKNVYKELFTLDSGESKEILDNFIENTNLGEVGTLSGELMMLNILNGEPTDFKISWNTVYSPNIANSGTKQLVPSGEINFSKLTMRLGNQYEAPTNRQQVLEVINVVRIILGYTVLVLLGANLWETIMRVLGVGVGMYEENEEEKQRLEITEETEIYNDEANGQSYIIQTTNYPRSKLKYRKRQNNTKIPNKRRIGF